MEQHQVPELGLEYEMWGQAPVQALGTIAGREFYFRSRHSEWEFEVANAEGVLPTDVGEPPAYHRNGRYAAASYMPFSYASELIRQLAAEYLQSQNT